MRHRSDMAHRRATPRRSCRWLILDRRIRRQASAAAPRIRSQSSTEKPGVHSPLFQRMLMLLHCPFLVEQRPPRRWSWSLRAGCGRRLRSRRPVSAFVGLTLTPSNTRQSAGAFARHEAFRVADFVAAPLVFTPGGRALPYHMPVALSSHFNLTRRSPLEHARPGDDLHRRTSPDQSIRPRITQPIPFSIRHRTPNPGIKSASCVRASSFHSGSMAARSSADLDPEATSEWLTFEPGPDRPTHFRNLVVQW